MSQTAPSKRLSIKRPPGLRAYQDKDGNGLTIQRHWFTSSHAILGTIGLFILSVLLCIITGEGFSFGFIFPLLLPVGFLSYALLGMINSTTMHLTRKGLSIDHGPIPWPGQQLITQQIEQLYVTKTILKGKNSTTYRYNLWAKLKNEVADLKLLSGLDKPHHAHYLEQVIEEFLQIEDKPMAGEWDVKQITRLGFELAEAYGLDLSAGYDHLAVRGHRDGTRIDFTIRSLYEAPNTKISVTAVRSRSAAAVMTPQAVETLFDLEKRRVKLKGKLQPLPSKEGLLYEQNSLMAGRSVPSLLKLMGDLVGAQPGVIATGGQLVPLLHRIQKQKGHLLGDVAEAWLRRIADDTMKRLSRRTEAFICADCLTHLDGFTLSLGLLDSVTYYGCRLCRHSHHLLKTSEGVEAVLDRRWSDIHRQQGDVVQVNWLNRQELFDFDRVAILNADDEAVERFAVQIGNDTDPLRRPTYPKMVCTIAPGCDLSPNTLKILERTFGRVEVGTG